MALDVSVDADLEVVLDLPGALPVTRRWSCE